MADESERPGAPAERAKQLGDQPVIDDSAMDDLLEKLKMLNYETEFLKGSSGTTFKPLSRTYFAVASDNANLQFYYFTTLCAWLLGLSGRRDFEAPGQFDDPNASSTNLLNELRAMSLNVSGIPPNRIRPGHGDGVLTILHLLADRALLARGFAFRSVEYPPPRTDMEERVGGEGDAPVVDDPEAIDDNIAVDSDSDDEEFVGNAAKRTGGGGAEMIEPQVSAEVWALEVERVAPLLQYRTDDVRDWRARVENAATLLKAVDKMYPDVKVMLERMGDDLTKTLERIQKREHTLQQQFSDQVEEYRSKLRDLQAVQETFNVANRNVQQLSNELNSVSEALDTTKAEIQEREEKTSDVTPLVKIKEALNKVKSEIKEMSLRIGVLQHTVLYHTLRQQKARRSSPQLTALGYDESAMLDPDFSGYM